ncbi:unnamed protein product, partial [Mesorhabditis belari]|uniref:Uncharacterized protein n=1 Tax=Mesorhabditis belari TaxID=2138241 RepID=A0AAF3E896_9BILA
MEKTETKTITFATQSTNFVNLDPKVSSSFVVMQELLKTEKPTSSDQNDDDGIRGHRCLICKARATGYHFDAQSCSACAAFFRRAVALNKSFHCITGNGECQVHYSMPQICRACRYERCLHSGMNRNVVQPKRPTTHARRAFSTKSGLKRNKSFANDSPIQIEIHTKFEGLSPKIGIESEISPLSVISDCRSMPNRENMQEEDNSPPSAPPGLLHPNARLPLQIAVQNSTDVLDVLIREEMKLGERRRIIFCERPVERLLGQNPHCPYTAADIRPLSFREFRKSIRTHILFIYEWLQAWPDYSTLNNSDKVSFLRKCVLFHTILDPVYISLQCGLPDKFVMQNGGYVSCKENSDDGWSDEKEISGQTKKMIYKPLLERILNEIIPPLQQIEITFEEFVALKAFVSFQGAIENVSQEGRPAMKRQLDALIRSLHKHYLNKGAPAEERLGTIILLLSSIFSTGLEFVESHRAVEFFDLWHLDSLLRQLLNLDAIFQQQHFNNNNV